MAYQVVVRTLPNKAVVYTESFKSLEEARKAADFGSFGGPRPVEIVVIGEDGAELSSREFKDA